MDKFFDRIYWEIVIVEFSEEVKEDVCDVCLKEKDISTKIGSKLIRVWDQEPASKCPWAFSWLISIESNAEVLVCDNNILNQLQTQELQSRVHVIKVSDFNLSYVENLILHRRAGFCRSQLSLSGWFQVQLKNEPSLPSEYTIPDYLLPLLDLELPNNTKEQAHLVLSIMNTFGPCQEAITQVLVAMRTCRYLAQLELEGAPYQTTIAVGPLSEKIGETIFSMSDPLSYDLDPKQLPVLEDFFELAQGLDTYVIVDYKTGIIKGIFRFPPAFDSGRLTRLVGMAQQLKAILLHLPGNRGVELYTPNCLAYEHDGFAWTKWRLRFLQENLKDILPTKELRTLLEAIDHLSFRRISSIIAIDPDNFKNIEAANVDLKDMRTLENHPIPIGTGMLISSLGPAALASMLRLDGAHLISNKGAIIKIAQGVIPKDVSTAPSSASGTGRRAAKDLSDAFPKAIVVKVSASGGKIKVYKKGWVAK